VVVNILGIQPSNRQGATTMIRKDREELLRRLAQARRLALEPSDPLTRERLAQLVEDLELRLQELRQVA
jgi:hypothetical protein